MASVRGDNFGDENNYYSYIGQRSEFINAPSTVTLDEYSQKMSSKNDNFF